MLGEFYRRAASFPWEAGTRTGKAVAQNIVG
jgi:hypothetical protein